MLHLPKLRHNKGIDTKSLSAELKKLEEANFSAALIENFTDIPFSKSQISDFEFAKISVIANILNNESSIPIGINILRNAVEQAFSLASALDLAFIRCNIWEGVYVTDQGLIEGAAKQIYDLKLKLQSEVKVLADVHVKHATPLGNFTVDDAAENALLRGGADAVIISGGGTGKEVDFRKLDDLAKSRIRPIIGSGLSIDNIKKFQNKISGAIVGTSIKYDNRVENDIDPEKANELSQKWHEFFR